MEYLTIEQEEVLQYAVHDLIAYDRRQAACMIDAMTDQLSNSHLTVDYKMTLSRRVRAARRKWFQDCFIDIETYSLPELFRLSRDIHTWSCRLSDLFVTNARMIRERMSRIRELNFNRQRLQWCL